MTRSESCVIPAQAGIRKRRLCILGAPGTGKTTLARELAQHMALTLVDDPRDAELVLLLGLDLPGTQVHAAEDARLREGLQSAGIAWQVVYGTGAQRLQGALAALGALPPSAPQTWQWTCEKCSDPECEHRLFKHSI